MEINNTQERKEIQDIIARLTDDGGGCSRQDVDRAVLFYKDNKEELDVDLAAVISYKHFDYDLPCEYEELIWPKGY